MTLQILSLLAALVFGTYLWGTFAQSTEVFLDDDLKKDLEIEVKKIFILRNQSLLSQNTDMLTSIYDKNVRNGLWAYEHEIKKMKYLHKWSDKQAVKFIKIDSHVMVTNAKEKGDGYTVSLKVSTEYRYVYENSPASINTFRIGTYHSLDIMPKAEGWLITKEWYTDPFADSLHLDDIKSQEIKQFILSSAPQDLSVLNERRIKAVAYADQYCGAASLPEYGFKYNPKYRNFNPMGGDCANFASQMLFEGGGFRKTGTWNYKNGTGSRAWLNAQGFNSYMLNSGRASLIARGSFDKVFKLSYKLLPGDYIAYEKNGKVTHISVVTGIDSKGYALVNSHNTDRYRVPWDLGWSNKGIRFWLVRVHY